MTRLFLLLLALSAPAAAYLDPATGSILVQAFLAGVAALAVAYSSLKSKVRGLLGRDDKSDNAPSDKEDKSDSEIDEESVLEASEAPNETDQILVPEDTGKA